MSNTDILKLLDSCEICPRRCKVNRNNGQTSYCKHTSEIRLSRAALHFWEEPCVSGENGSGTVFFSGCNLGCLYCQNQQISNSNNGKAVSINRLAEIFINLQNQNAHNINLVTPTHFMPQIIKAIEIAKKNGLSIPIVYNTSGYETVDSIKLLEPYVDIFLCDFKYYDNNLGQKYSSCKDYCDVAKKAIHQMVKQVGNCVFNENGIMQKGVIIRHLVLPEHIDDSKDILDYLYDSYKDTIYISIMNQFTPVNHIEKYNNLNRTITDDEYNEVLNYAMLIGLKNVYIQEGKTASESFIPPFDFEGV